MRLVNGPRSARQAAVSPAESSKRPRTREITPPRPQACLYIGTHDGSPDHPEVERPPDYRGSGANRDARRAGFDPPTPQRRETLGSRCAVQMWGLGDQTVL